MKFSTRCQKQSYGAENTKTHFCQIHENIIMIKDRSETYWRPTGDLLETYWRPIGNPLESNIPDWT